MPTKKYGNVERDLDSQTFDYNNTFAWYAIYAKGGQEENVKHRVQATVDARKMSELVQELFIPYSEFTTESGEVKYGPTFYGYVFIKCKMTNDLWFVIRNTRDVFGFIGSSGKGVKPIPIPESEIRAQKIKSGVIDLSELNLQVSSKVKVLVGPFKDQLGTISSIDETNKTVNVVLEMFSRATDIQLGATEIKVVE